jgi:hypothetical protein
VTVFAHADATGRKNIEQKFTDRDISDPDVKFDLAGRILGAETVSPKFLENEPVVRELGGWVDERWPTVWVVRRQQLGVLKDGEGVGHQTSSSNSSRS